MKRKEKCKLTQQREEKLVYNEIKQSNRSIYCVMKLK